MRNLDVLHIYYGTQGVSGLYTDRIYKSLLKGGFNQDVIVSNYYPFNYGRRIFFKYSDLSSGIKNSVFRRFIRIFEMIYGLLYCLIYILFNKPRVVNYSLNSSFITDVLFLKLIKIISNAKVIITCHDVVPFSKNEENKNRQIKYRFKIFEIADYLLVHTEKSIQELNTKFFIDKNKILIHPFPIMSLKYLFKQDVFAKPIYDFAFIGHLRKEKGIELLAKAWVKFNKLFPEAKLLIAGNAPYHMDFLDKIKNLNVTLQLEYLSDDKYYDCLKLSKTIILPYISGTNSGVIYNLIDLHVNIIYSDLDMFLENTLLIKDGLFKQNDYDSLFQRMVELYSKEDKSMKNVEIYELNFDKKVKDVYDFLLKRKF